MNNLIRMLLVLGSASVACACTNVDKAAQLQSRAVGMTALQIISEFGQPSVTRNVASVPGGADPCSSDAVHVKVFEYHAPDKGAVRSALESVGIPVLDFITYVCLDKSDTARATFLVEF